MNKKLNQIWHRYLIGIIKDQIHGLCQLQLIPVATSYGCMDDAIINPEIKLKSYVNDMGILSSNIMGEDSEWWRVFFVQSLFFVVTLSALEVLPSERKFDESASTSFSFFCPTKAA